MPIWNRKYIFQRWMFHCHVSFWGGRYVIHLYDDRTSQSQISNKLHPFRLVTGVVLTKVTAILVEDVVFRHWPLLTKRLCGCGFKISTSRKKKQRNFDKKWNGMNMPLRNKIQNQAQIFRNRPKWCAVFFWLSKLPTFYTTRRKFAVWKFHRSQINSQEASIKL